MLRPLFRTRTLNHPSGIPYTVASDGDKRHRRRIWTATLQEPIQSYISTSTEPHVNLSIEHYLLQSTPHDSIVLFFYTNSPSLVIGRNQNPWYEANLHLVRNEALHLVRRRSGGGTVFHDSGNINWSVISPSKSFARNTHASMVVRALRSPECGVARARVNERHDIVLDQAEERRTDLDSSDVYNTPWTTFDDDALPPLKCSGSAFKITRTRALHHGTCLLQSRSLRSMSRMLQSPGKAFIQAKGVESVRSPVGNAGVSHESFISAVRRQFEEMYNEGKELGHVMIEEEDALAEQSLRHGYEEMKTMEWKFGQTPRFSFTAQTGEVSDLAGREPLVIHAEVEKGLLKRLSVSAAERTHVYEPSKGESLYRASWTWVDRLAQLGFPREMTGEWMQCVFPLMRAEAPEST